MPVYLTLDSQALPTPLVSLARGQTGASIRNFLGSLDACKSLPLSPGKTKPTDEEGEDEEQEEEEEEKHNTLEIGGNVKQGQGHETGQGTGKGIKKRRLTKSFQQLEHLRGTIVAVLEKVHSPNICTCAAAF